MNDVISELRAAFEELADRAPLDLPDTRAVRPTRKRFASALLAAAAVVAIAVGTVAIAAGHGAGHRGIAPAANSASATGMVPPTPQTVASNFIRLLGAQGKVSGLAGEGYGNFVHARMYYDYGRGKAVSRSICSGRRHRHSWQDQPTPELRRAQRDDGREPWRVDHNRRQARHQSVPGLHDPSGRDPARGDAEGPPSRQRRPMANTRANSPRSCQDGIEIDIYQGPYSTGNAPSQRIS